MNNQNGLYQNNSTNNLQHSNSHKNNKRILLLIGLIALIVIVVFSILILKKDDVKMDDKELSRTVMIYMVGADLESRKGLATVDLDSIKYDKMDNKNVNVVMIAGGSTDWHNDYINEDETSIFELTEDGFEKVKTQKIKNMGDAKVFSDFLNYVYENYKTDKYDLIFWNHGNAIQGSEYDTISNDNLTLKEMSKGLSDSKFDKKNKLEVVIFRTCLNGSIEVADVFDEYSDYLVASEEVTLGFKFSSVLNFINDIEVSDTGYDVSLKFVNSYKKQISDLKKFSSEYVYSTYSIVDLSEVDELINSVNDFFDDIDVAKNYNKIAKVRSNLYQYAYTNHGAPYYDMVDLYSLVYSLKDLSSDKAEAVLNNLKTTVVYNWATNDKSRGMSIFFPYNGGSSIKSNLKLYDGFDSLDEYNKFISKFYDIQSNDTKSYSFVSNDIDVSTNNEVLDSYDFTLELTQEQLEGYTKAEYLVFMDKGDGYYWPVYKGIDVDLNGNTLNANINERALKIVTDDGAYIVPLFETYSENDYIKYTTYVILEDFREDFIMDNASLSLILDKETNKVEVGSVILSSGSDEDSEVVVPDNILVDLNDYQYIAFGAMSHKLLDENGNFSWEVYNNNSNGIFEGVEISVDEVSNFQLSSFDDENDYYAVFRIYDVNNNVYYSNLIKMN